jgi:hypothetical protein
VKDKKNQETLPVWPVGGFYRPGCQLEDIQQVFSCVGQSDGKTSLRKTLLVQWNDQGFYPPLSQKKEDRMTVFQTNRQNPYIKFIHEIRKGVITLKLRNLRISEESACFTYKSIDMKPDVIGKAFIHFMRD